MERGPKDGVEADGEARNLPGERRPAGAPEEARGGERKETEDAEWMSMVTGDPALFIKVKGSE